MDIIISADKTILRLLHNAPDKTSMEITKEEYRDWISGSAKDEFDEEQV